VTILKQAQLHRGEIPHHPFQSGLVVRNNKRWLTIALSGSSCLVVERVTDEKGADLRSAIKEGDRLFTSSARLDDAKQERVSIGPTGIKPRGRPADSES
jgi:hypothetical protein